MTNFALSKLHSFHAWGARLLFVPPHSSGALSVASSISTNRVEKRNVGRAEVCFVTNDPSYVHEQAHWINAIRGREEKDKEMKHKVVSGRCLVLFVIKLIPSVRRFYFCFCKVSSA